MFKLSIITVVYNNINCIEETILNVLNTIGGRSDVEYIIIDGGSSDGTIDIIKKYDSSINYWVSERDKGIYDAMNKGIVIAKGDWIIFMNSGDFFQDKNSVSPILSGNEDVYNSDVVYGNTLTKNEKRIVFPPKKISKNFFFLNTICHQSVFFNKNLFIKVGGFNLDYKIISDREFLYKSICLNGKFHYSNVIVSVWDEEGFSKDNISLFKKEETLFRKQNFNFIKRSYLLFKFRFQNLKKK